MHFVVDIDEKSSPSGGFQYNLMMIRDSGSLFWGHLVYPAWIFSDVYRQNTTFAFYKVRSIW